MTCCCGECAIPPGLYYLYLLQPEIHVGLILATSKMYPNVSKQLIIQEEQGHCIVEN